MLPTYIQVFPYYYLVHVKWEVREEKQEMSEMYDKIIKSSYARNT